jgi:hypothetical protein
MSTVPTAMVGAWPVPSKQAEAGAAPMPTRSTTVPALSRAMPRPVVPMAPKVV